MRSSLSSRRGHDAHDGDHGPGVDQLKEASDSDSQYETDNDNSDDKKKRHDENAQQPTNRTKNGSGTTNSSNHHSKNNRHSARRVSFGPITMVLYRNKK